MLTTNGSDTADEMLPLFALGREFINRELTYVKPHYMFCDEREGGKEVETTTAPNRWWPDPVLTYPASSATYVAIICPYCGHSHRVEQCPRVEQIEYYRSGAIRRVRLRPILTEVSSTVTVSWPTPPANDSGEPV